MGRQGAGTGASGGKHASSRSTVDDYRRQIGRYQTHHSRAKFKGRQSPKTSISGHSQKNWTLIVISAFVLLVLLSAFYAVFAVEMIDAFNWLVARIRS